MRRLTIGVAACTEAMGLLVAMAWADGELQDEEKVGIRTAADTLNLSQELRDRLEGFMEEAPPLRDLKLAELAPQDAEFAYVAAAWLARVDDSVEEEEWDLLAEIGELLEMDIDRREELTKFALDLEPPGEGESWASGIVALFKAIVTMVEDDEVEVAFE